MFWEEQVNDKQESELQKLVNEDKFDAVITHPLCFQELRQNSDYLVHYLTKKEHLQRMLDRSLYRIIVDDVDPVDQFKNSISSIAVLCMGNSYISEALMDDKEIWTPIAEFLKDSDSKPYVNHVTCGFYKRLIVALVSKMTEFDTELIHILENDGFVDLMLANLKYGAIAELITKIPMHGVNEFVQSAIFEMYVRQNLPIKMYEEMMKEDVSDDVLENIVYLHSEFDEMQLKSCFSARVFSEHLFNVEPLSILLDAAFPADRSCFKPRVTTAACQILQLFLDLNHSSNEAGFKVHPEHYMKIPMNEMYDRGYRLETYLMNKADLIVSYLLQCLEDQDADATVTAVNCLTVLQGLLNSDFLTTHRSFKTVFSQDRTHWRLLLSELFNNAHSTIIATRIVSVFAYMLNCSSDLEDFPLVDMLVACEENICHIVATKVKQYEAMSPDERDRIQYAATQQLSAYIRLAQEDDSTRAKYMNMLINESSASEAWNELSNKTILSMTDASRLTNLTTTTNQSVVVDELEESADHEDFSFADLIGKEKPVKYIGFDTYADKTTNMFSDMKIKESEADFEAAQSSQDVNVEVSDDEFEKLTPEDWEFDKSIKNDQVVPSESESKKTTTEFSPTKDSNLKDESVDEEEESVEESSANVIDEWEDQGRMADDFPPFCNTPDAKKIMEENVSENKSERFDSPDIVFDRLDSEKKTPKHSRIHRGITSPCSSRIDLFDECDTPKRSGQNYEPTKEDSLFGDFSSSSPKAFSPEESTENDWPTTSLTTSPQNSSLFSSNDLFNDTPKKTESDDWPTSPSTPKKDDAGWANF
ncbi:unnamed protein product [Bursaphelenchus okinawaensis]|uniref:Uncharacterized protein n=1 Tax=Bursaphelenchus okinawaensis TaxID=465554 RepID=A0A811K966_9BILA|nr:unnamed protein product [Bursaphelenchus okinawaensis]CAG9094715.1 unnamed protein product [Bursaphelenchus okinawaensis]